jgi:hypothetical protein
MDGDFAVSSKGVMSAPISNRPDTSVLFERAVVFEKEKGKPLGPALL